jgi:hypothetical protein
MTALQDRLFAGRCVQEARAQEELARSLRPTPAIPSQRERDESPASRLSVVAPAEPESAQ